MSFRRRAWAAAVLLAVAALGLPAGAGARCRSVEHCVGARCVPVEECDSALDPRAEREPGSPPPARSLTPPVHRPAAPVPRLGPPPGSSHCRPAYVCVAGRCAWETICR